MILAWPQITYIAIACLGLGLMLALHGTPRKGKHNFWVSLVSTFLMIFILYKGGFFG